MSKLTKTIMAGAFAAIGLVAVGDLAFSHNRADVRQEFGLARGAVFALLPQVAMDAATFEERWSAGFPAAPAVRVATLEERTAPETSRASSCREQAWPYVSRDCLIAGEGSPVRRAVRTIALDRVQRAETESR